MVDVLLLDHIVAVNNYQKKEQANDFKLIWNFIEWNDK